MAENNLTFAKIVANPRADSWSQVYSAGKLFAVLSLEATGETEEKDYLNVLGKEIFDTLEQEFFTLETKDLESIKEAIQKTSQKIPQEITCSFVIASVVNNILYIYILGNGKIALKREEKLGNLLETSDQKPDSLKSASGFLQDNDVIVLQTKQFSNVISAETLSEFLDNLPPSEAAENLAPLIHEKEEAGAASIIISYKTPIEEEIITVASEPEAEKEQEEVEEKPQSPFYAPSVNIKTPQLGNIKTIFSSLLSKLKIPKKLDISHPRKVILTIVVVIFVVLVISVVFALQKQQGTKNQSIFNGIYPQAQKKYEEGQGLVELNQSLANDSFNQAKQIIEAGKDKLPKDSKEEKELLTLLAKINSALGPSSTSDTTGSQAKQVDLSVSSLLLAESKNQAIYFTYDDKNIYGLTTSAVYSLNLDGTGKKNIIVNNNDWQQGLAVAPYFGNIYILDKKQNQILKYVSSDSGFSKTNYFGSDTTPDFSKAISMAIDSSVYILSSDGTIAKFTKGKGDSFSITGLNKSLTNPTKIFTNANLDNVYVLDNGNSRIVVFDKNGAYKAQYATSIIKSANDFDISEKDKKAYVLSDGKLYEVDLK
jgi:hypothetical protein